MWKLLVTCGFTRAVRFRLDTNQMHGRQRGPGRSALSYALKLAVASVGKRAKEDASVLIYGLTKVHGEGENNDKKEEIDAKERMQKSAEGFWREHVEMHPYESDDGKNAKHDDDGSGEAFCPVCGCKGLLDEGDFGVRIFGVGLLGFGAHAGFLSKVRCLRSVATP